MPEEIVAKHGLQAIQRVFKQAKAQKRAAFIPYYPVGYPDYETSVEVLAALAEAGADIIEVGVPFSDPLADGPTIQAATQIALQQGTTPRMCIKAIETIRQRNIQTPVMLMGYANPFMAYGYKHLTSDAQHVGIDGLVIPDMPADEVDTLQTLVEAADLGFVHFVAPTSSSERIRLSAEKARGYIYLVSVTGVTGERQTIATELRQYIASIRLVTQKPIAVGFGISTPEQAAEVGAIADGVIVGSALVKSAEKGVQAVYQLAKSLRDALNAS
ncbi:MAG: tryptophan synthase subunit alpha [Phototrophicales bacterium]|nr:MAG: tryptophan synthase subunit alpha [Phototrophicales bacterium]